MRINQLLVAILIGAFLNVKKLVMLVSIPVDGVGGEFPGL